MNTADELLVDRLRDGDRDAFVEVVQRYQNLVCSVAYSSTGDLNTSEELAQETFVTAWRSIRDLREPERLRQWLCGIVRNLVRNSARRRKHDVLQSATAIDDERFVPFKEIDPVEATIASEEVALMNRTLETIPEIYREPLILYYREQHSVANVAQLLSLSEDAVKQRLSRGRKLLRAEVEAVLERGLRQTAPGRAFTMGVIAALPVMTGTAKAATLTATGAKGIAAMHAAGWTGILGAVLGPVIGIAAGWLGMRMSLKAARSQRERSMIIQMSWFVMGLVTIFAIGLTLLILWGTRIAPQDPIGFSMAIFGLILAYMVLLFSSIFYFNRRQEQIRREDGTLNVPMSKVAEQLPAWMNRFQYPAVYESPVRLLGLPLISIRFNGAVGQTLTRRPAIGWIAIGDIAYGLLFANGPVAVGGIACGAISCGLVSFAGLSVGVLSFGGASMGVFSLGGFSLGFLAFGGFAAAWHSAMGGLAAARKMAIGGVAIAEHANDAVAKQFMENNVFFQVSNLLSTHGWIWIVIVGLTMVPLYWARMKMKSEAKD
jgi:RNA polymerase sigma factor (sigma-70 family)